MAVRRSSRLLFWAAIAGTGMFTCVNVHAGTAIPGQDTSLPPEAPSKPAKHQPNSPEDPAESKRKQETRPIEIYDLALQPIQPTVETPKLQLYPFGNAWPEQSAPLPPPSLGNPEHNAIGFFSLVSFVNLFDGDKPQPSPGITGTTLGDEIQSSEVLRSTPSFIVAASTGSTLPPSGNDQTVLHFDGELSLQSNPLAIGQFSVGSLDSLCLPLKFDTSSALDFIIVPTQPDSKVAEELNRSILARSSNPASTIVQTTATYAPDNDSTPKLLKWTLDDEVLHAHFGLISELAIQDIDQRVLQRIGETNSETAAHAQDSTDLSNRSDLPAGTSERAMAVANEDPTRVDGLADLPAPWGSGGGSSSPIAAVLNPLPINPLSAYALPHRDSLIGSFRAQAVVARTAAPSAKSASASSLTMSAPAAILTAATASSVTAALSLPAGVLRYRLADLHPQSAAWITSHISRLNGGRLAGSVGDATGAFAHAALWNLSVAGFVDVHPVNGGFIGSSIADIRGAQAVGIGSTSRTDHALLWINANPNTTVDLNPAPFKSSYALGTDGTKQIGYGYTTVPVYGEESHALLWNSSPTDYVDLNPVNFIFTYAYGGDKLHQAGFGLSLTNNLHALIWAGSAQSVIDIQPTLGSYTDSRAFAVRGIRAGGYATDEATQYPHAMLWTALNGDSAVDLHPAGFLDSQITALNNSTEVGYGRVVGDHTGNTHALLWTDRNSGVVDLNNFLPAHYISAEADGIDSSGNVVGWAKDSITGNFHAVEWLAVVPEPTGLTPLAGLASLVLLTTRARRKRIA